MNRFWELYEAGWVLVLHHPDISDNSAITNPVYVHDARLLRDVADMKDKLDALESAGTKP